MQLGRYIVVLGPDSRLTCAVEARLHAENRRHLQSTTPLDPPLVTILYAARGRTRIRWDVEHPDALIDAEGRFVDLAPDDLARAAFYGCERPRLRSAAQVAKDAEAAFKSMGISTRLR